MKTLFKISFTLLSVGWFIFMWFALWGSRHEQYGIWVFFTGLTICLMGGLCFGSLLSNKGFWLRNDILDREIEAFKKAKDKYLKTEKNLAKVVDKYQEKIDKLQNGKQHKQHKQQ